MDVNTHTGRRGEGGLDPYVRDTLNDDGERLLTFFANHGLAMLNNMFFSTHKSNTLRTDNGHG